MTSQLQLGAWAPPLLGELSQYHTPPAIARKLPELLPSGTQRILEPSAGGGNLISGLFATLGDGIHVHAVEIDKQWAAALAARFAKRDVAIRVADFLQLDPQEYNQFDAVVMNPPLDAGLGPNHVRHALRFAPRVISILRSGNMHSRNAWEYLWSHCELATLIHLVARGGFKGARTDFVIVDVRRDGQYDRATTVDWWEA